jgi:glycosyltransferase involved in cell wall biosynthesis
MFEQLLKEKPKARLLLVGAGETEAEIREMVAQRGSTEQVILTGVRQDVNQRLFTNGI